MSLALVIIAGLAILGPTAWIALGAIAERLNPRAQVRKLLLEIELLTPRGDR